MCVPVRVQGSILIYTEGEERTFKARTSLASQRRGNVASVVGCRKQGIGVTRGQGRTKSHVHLQAKVNSLVLSVMESLKQEINTS